MSRSSRSGGAPIGVAALTVLLSSGLVSPRPASGQEPTSKPSSRPSGADSEPDKAAQAAARALRNKKAHKKLVSAQRLASVDATRSEALALEALKLRPRYDAARLFLGWLYNVRIGDLDKSLEQYDVLIRTTENKVVKANALASRGGLLFVRDRDFEGALELYKAAWETSRQWEFADRASNLNLHVDKVKNATVNARLAFKYLQATIKRTEANKAVSAARRASKTAALGVSLIKVKLQLATCLHVNGEKEEATKLLEGVDEFPRAVKYNLALLRAAQGETEGVTSALLDFMLTRKSPKTRNLLRAFIREEPLFQRFVKLAEWTPLIVDEKGKG